MKQRSHILDLPHIVKALYYAICGLKTVFHSEVAFKQEILLSIFVLPLGLHFGTTTTEKAILISSWLLILLMEIINSAIETVVDRISLEIHPLSKKIKDISSAAVLVAIINAVIIWGIILFM